MEEFAISSVGIFYSSVKNEKFLRTYHLILPKFHLILPKFHLILPKNFCFPPKEIEISSGAIWEIHREKLH